MSRLTPWAGWICGIAGWFVAGQADAILAQWDCSAAHPLLMLAIAIGGALLIITGAALSFGVWRTRPASLDQRGDDTRRFIAATATIASSLFALALVLQTASSFILLRCHA